MARIKNRLTAIEVKSIRTNGRYADGGGLYLRVQRTDSKSWVFRWVRYGNENEMGLGAYPDVSLADARSLATIARKHLHAGLNPKIERDRQRDGMRTFGDVADEYLAAMLERWNNEKTRWQWQKTLTEFAKPIRRVPIAQIETSHILKLLKPIWTEKPETAAKARMRLEAVLDYATVRDWRTGENPARWKGHLKSILPPRQRLTKGHHAAMAYRDVPEFFDTIKRQEATSAKALAFLILTAGRTGEVLGATWSEIDFEARTWTIPASRMKAKADHRVPLTDAAVEILAPLFEARTSQFVFAGMKPNRPLSNMSLEMLMKRMKIEGATPHGFRSSFRDWAGDKTSFSREVAEQALAHKIGNSTEQAYRRGDAFEKRRRLMEAWQLHLLPKTDNIVRAHFGG